MQQNKTICQSSRKCTAARNLRQFSKRAKLTSEHSNLEKEPAQKSSRTIRSLPGSLIHISQSADGKLRWDPPSSSLSESRAHSGCLSAQCGPASIVALTRSEGVKASEKPFSTISTDSLKAEPASPSLTSRFNCVTSASSITWSSDTAEGSDVQGVSIGSHQQASSSSELSAIWEQHELESKRVPKNAGAQDPRTCVLSPFLMSKLKPGKHILGVKKYQNYIRPGQLRHWAVGNSPHNFANLPADSFKGKACRTLAF
ncbi:hypothetical protein GOP47_0028268 [Adiantum capillus-veneris]|nr:hypothetical protein GOP47_0028268 [Adiantum capillus-veneris]